MVRFNSSFDISYAAFIGEHLNKNIFAFIIVSRHLNYCFSTAGIIFSSKFLLLSAFRAPQFCTQWHRLTWLWVGEAVVAEILSSWQVCPWWVVAGSASVSRGEGALRRHHQNCWPQPRCYQTHQRLWNQPPSEKKMNESYESVMKQNQMGGFVNNILIRESQGTFEIPYKISLPYTERQVKRWNFKSY